MVNLKLEVENILNDNEKILNFYYSKTSESAYFILIKEEDKFITFRVSDHPTTSFYSNRTFKNYKDIKQLVEEIRYYLDNSQWYIFRYEDYFTLKVLSSLYFNRMEIYVDNTMGIFDRAVGGLVFYQSRRLGKKYKEFNIVSESFQKN